MSESHVYLSTSCLHEEHEYCKNKDGRAGPKRPAECKFCSAKCTCACHVPSRSALRARGDGAADQLTEGRADQRQEVADGR